MSPSRYTKRICMRFEQEHRGVLKCIRKSVLEFPGSRDKLSKRAIDKLIFENCDDCLTMAAIPQGAFAARKVRENNERRFLFLKMEKKGSNDRDSKQDTGYSKMNPKEEGRELTPLKYNSKLMNSIWGLYNRYSVHNFKKNTDGDDKMMPAVFWGPNIVRNRSPAGMVEGEGAAAQVRQFLGTGNARL